MDRAFIDGLAIVFRGHNRTTFDEFEMTNNADTDTRAVYNHFKTVWIDTFHIRSGARTITRSSKTTSQNRSTRRFRGD